MKALSIIAAFTGLVAVSSTAAIRPAKYGVDLCTERDFQSCTHRVVEAETCTRLGPDLRNKIWSVKPDPGVLCYFVSDDCPDTSWDNKTLAVLTGAPMPDVSTLQFNELGGPGNIGNRIKSYFCRSVDGPKAHARLTSSSSSEDHGLIVRDLGIFAVPKPVNSPDGRTSNHENQIKGLRCRSIVGGRDNAASSTSGAVVLRSTDVAEGSVLPDTALVEVCPQRHFEGQCETLDVQLHSCVNLTSPLVYVPSNISSLHTDGEAFCQFFDNDHCESNNNTFDYMVRTIPDLSVTPLDGINPSKHESQIKSFVCTQNKPLPIFRDRDNSAALSPPALVMKSPSCPWMIKFCTGRNFQGCVEVTPGPLGECVTLNSDLSMRTSSLITGRSNNCVFYFDDRCQNRGVWLEGRYSDLSNAKAPGLNEEMRNYENQIRAFKCF